MKTAYYDIWYIQQKVYFNVNHIHSKQAQVNVEEKRQLGVVLWNKNGLLTFEQYKCEKQI